MKIDSLFAEFWDAVGNRNESSFGGRAGTVAIAGLVVFFALAPIVTGRRLFLGYVLVFSIFAVGYNLFIGYSGPLSFGHAPFYGLGAYLGILALQHLELSLIPVFVVVIAGVGVAGAIMGIVSLQRHGIYFAMISLALAQVFWAAIYYSSELTGGADGMRLEVTNIAFMLVTRLDFSSLETSYYFILFVFVAILLFIKRLINSPFGLTLQAIRENRMRASFLGYNITATLLFSFILSAMISGIAGLLKVLLVGNASPGDLYWTTTGDVLMMTLIGGIGSFLGPVVGALAFLSIEELMTGFTDNFVLYFGGVVLLIVLFMPEGVVGWVRSKLQNIAKS